MSVSKGRTPKDTDEWAASSDEGAARIVSEGLCEVPGCPWPSDPDWHKPLCRHGLRGQHHHLVKRSQGGKQGMQVFICPKCHDLIDNGRWSDAVIEAWRGEGKHHWDYCIFDTMGKQVCCEDVTRWVIGEAGRKDTRRTGLTNGQSPTRPAVPARLSDHPHEEAKHADRETAQGMHGEAGESQDAPEHWPDGTLPEAPGGDRSGLQEVDRKSAFERIWQGQHGVESARLGGAGVGEPPDPPPEIDAVGGIQIGHTIEIAPLEAEQGIGALYPPTVSEPDVAYEATGLVLRENLPWERWVEIGGTLQQMERSIQWWIGDWLIYGEDTYGETYAQAVEATGMKVQRLMDYAWVSRKLPISARTENLSWSHHKAVAHLSPEAQEIALHKAEAQALSTRELHELVAEDRPPECEASEDGRHHYRCAACGRER